MMIQERNGERLRLTPHHTGEHYFGAEGKLFLLFLTLIQSVGYPYRGKMSVDLFMNKRWVIFEWFDSNSATRIQ